MRLIILIFLLVAPSFGWAEKIEVEWPKQKFEPDTCIIDVNPESYFYQQTFKILDLVYQRSDYFPEGTFFYVAWPVGDSAPKPLKDYPVTYSMMTLLPWPATDYMQKGSNSSWMEMPNCP